MQQITTQQNSESWESSTTTSNVSAIAPIPGHLPTGSTAQTRILQQEVTTSQRDEWSWRSFSHLLLTAFFVIAGVIWFLSQVAIPLSKHNTDPRRIALFLTIVAMPFLLILSYRSAKTVITFIARWLTTLAQRKKG